MTVGRVMCVILAAAAAAAATAADDSLEARLKALEAARLGDRAELQRLRTKLEDRDRLQEGLAQLRHELRQLSRRVGGEASVRDGMVELRSEIESMR